MSLAGKVMAQNPPCLCSFLELLEVISVISLDTCEFKFFIGWFNFFYLDLQKIPLSFANSN